MGWMDVLILVILIIHILKGWTKGLILSFFQFTSFIIAGIVAKIYYPVVSTYIAQNTAIFIKIQEIIGNRFKITLNEQAISGGIVANRNIFQMLKFPKTIEEFFMKNDVMQVYSTRAMEGVHSYVSDTLTRMFINFMSILLVFFIIKMILSILGYLLHNIASLPVLKQFNCLGGMIFGFIKGIFAIFILLTIITPLMTMMDIGILVEGIEKSVLTKYLYHHNPIMGMIQRTICL
ncbi:CvpA family protein [Clostridiaceae bacterium 35-E11]